MAQYKIKVIGPDGRTPIVIELDMPDDMAALNSALDICRKHQVEVWEGRRQIGAVSLSGTPRLAL